ncbi:MAG: RecQ family ATP-dependent DNA helicase, partial [Syntrophothermus sp.]
MNNIQQILLKYWGYSSFRPLQEEIILSVLEGKDTLALLPTGGGKSITFQVPAMATEGVCLVISPLISLMKDQIDNLKKKGINAAAIYSGMHQNEISLTLNDARFGHLNLLYVSPERLTSIKMQDALRRMKVSLIAVDEAHCISQWGYDFRPPYLKIAEIRQYLPGVPILALTATATPKVVEDIQQKLKFKQPNVFQKSFERKNLTYYVFHEEDKRRRILNIISKMKGIGVIYVRNRRETKAISDFLVKNRIASTCYHAGLAAPEREKRQNEWMREEKKVMVATNAFGMGIDKPNVRFVIHIDLPDSLEAYFQEAGRAGRDEKPAVAVLLYEQKDIIDVRENLEKQYPELKLIRNIYQALGNYLSIPVGNGKDFSIPFDLQDFAAQYKFQAVIVYNALKLLEKEGFLMLNEAIHQPSRIFIKTDKSSLYQFQVENPSLDPFIKTLLRSYAGIFTQFVSISEEELGRRNNLSAEKTAELLFLLQKRGILDYDQRSELPRIIFTEDRVEARDLTLSAG